VRYSIDVVGALDTLFQKAREQFVGEIFVTIPCERGILQDVLDLSECIGKKGAGFSLHQIPEHGAQCREARRGNLSHE